MQPTTLFALGIGETLLDVFVDGTCTVGGAPLNVTFHLHQLLQAFGHGSARMISRVGQDPMGDAILQHLELAGMDTATVSRSPVRPTGTAHVFVQDGHSGFEISQNTAWDELELSASITEAAQNAAAVVFGSLGQRCPAAGEVIRNVVSKVRGERLYDVNLRRSTRSGTAGYSAEIVQASLELATIAKLNDVELEEVAAMLGLVVGAASEAERQRELMEQLAKRFRLPLIALTRGPRGAMLLHKGSIYQLPDSKLAQSEVHPVGAGDAFAAGLLFGRMMRWKIEDCLWLADLMASWVVRNLSATPRLTPEMLESIRNHQRMATSAKA